MNKFTVNKILLKENILFIKLNIAMPYNEDIIKPKASITFLSENYARRLPIELSSKIDNKRNGVSYLSFEFGYELNYLWDEFNIEDDVFLEMNINYGNIIKNNVEIDKINVIEVEDETLFDVFTLNNVITLKPKNINIKKHKKSLSKKDIRRENKKAFTTFYNGFISPILFPILFPLKMLLKGIIYPFKKYSEYSKKQTNSSLRHFRPIFMRVINFFSLFIKVDNNLIVFLSDSRDDLSGNFKYIYPELKKLPNVKIKLYLHDNKRKASRSFRNKRLIDIARAKVIILDDFYPILYKRKLKSNQKVIQLWHACGAFKTFGFSRLGKEGGPDQNSLNHRNYDVAIVSSENIKGHYAEAFGISLDNVYSTGVPRTDDFFNEEYKNKQIEDFYNEFPYAKGKKVILFAPTFRGNGKLSAHYPVDEIRLEALYELLGDDYFFIYKLHPFIHNEVNIPDDLKHFAIDLTFKREINDLLFVTDVLITDYSSVIFEASLLDIPMIFFAYDLNEYIHSRDFYFEFKTMVPGKIVETFDEMALSIYFEDFKDEKIKEFKNAFFDDLDGKSTQRVVDLIKICLEMK